MSSTGGRPTTGDHLGLTDHPSFGDKQELKGVRPAAITPGSAGRLVTGEGDPFYRDQKTLLLPQRGAAANYPGHYHDGTGGDQDVSRGRVEAGGQQTDVVALLHQSPHSHCQNSPSCQLREQLHSKQMHVSFF